MFCCNVVSRWAQLVSFAKKYIYIFIYIYIYTVSALEIQNFMIEVQLKPKLHQLWRTALWLRKLQLSVFLKVVWVFWLKRLVPPLDRFVIVIKSRATCPPKSRCQSDLSTVSVLAKRSLHQDMMHSGCRGTAVPNVCLQAFSLFPLPNSLNSIKLWFDFAVNKNHTIFWDGLGIRES